MMTIKQLMHGTDAKAMQRVEVESAWQRWNAARTRVARAKREVREATIRLLDAEKTETMAEDEFLKACQAAGAAGAARLGSWREKWVKTWEGLHEREN